ELGAAARIPGIGVFRPYFDCGVVVGDGTRVIAFILIRVTAVVVRQHGVLRRQIARRQRRGEQTDRLFVVACLAAIRAAPASSSPRASATPKPKTETARARANLTMPNASIKTADVC